jgi:hypothetical protein
MRRSDFAISMNFNEFPDKLGRACGASPFIHRDDDQNLCLQREVKGIQFISSIGLCLKSVGGIFNASWGAFFRPSFQH